MNAIDAAHDILMALSQDNGCEFRHNDRQFDELVKAIELMQADGLKFDSGVSEDLATMETGEMEEKYRRYNGFHKLDALLNEIFDGEGWES